MGCPMNKPGAAGPVVELLGPLVGRAEGGRGMVDLALVRDELSAKVDALLGEHIRGGATKLAVRLVGAVVAGAALIAAAARHAAP